MSAVLGIDVSSFAIDLVWLAEDGCNARWERLPLAGTTSFARLRQVRDVMPALSEYDSCYLAAIERPKTHSFVSAAALFPVFGAVVACLPAALEVWDVSPTQWRIGLGLKGNASKYDAAQAVDDLHGPGTPDWPQDAFDAYAVAYYARELNARGLSLEQARERQLVLV